MGPSRAAWRLDERHFPQPIMPTSAVVYRPRWPARGVPSGRGRRDWASFRAVGRAEDRHAAVMPVAELLSGQFGCRAATGGPDTPGEGDKR